MDTVVNGTAKAWVNFNGSGTVAIRRAFNVSSITDNGTGDYSVNFTTAMVDVNYNVIATVEQPTAASSRGHLFGPPTTSAYTTSSIRLIAKLSADTTGFTDREFLNVTIFS